ncbi:MAG: TGS domain-containing protein, partial [Phycisphaerae bacterium]
MSVKVTLPDGSSREFDSSVTPADVAEDISSGLARAAVAAEVDGAMVDLTTPLTTGSHDVRLLTNRDPESLEVLRHTTAHVLAQAMVRLFGKDVKYTIGPALLDDFQYGFYYDFDLPRAISGEDLQKVESEMKKIVKEKLPIERIEMPVDEAKQAMRDIGQDYKAEMIDDLVATENVRTVSFYRQGDFIDMCRGPHLPHTGKVQAFKLVSTAGA